MSEEKIIEKIQKLLALSESSNKHEAERAMEKAQALMLEHNVNMRQVQDHDTDYINETTDTFKRQPLGSKYINSLLQEFFFVKVVQSKRRNGNFLNIIGEKNNVQTALFVRNFLIDNFKRLWDNFRKETGAKVKSRDSFYFGLYQGLKEKLDIQRLEAESKYELVLVNDPKAEEKMNELFGRNLSTSKNKMYLRDGQAQMAGHEAGKQINISAGALK